MRRRISTTLVLVAAPAVLAADAQFVKIEEKGGVLFAPLTQTRFEVVNRTVTVNVNGRAETRTIPETVPVTVRVNVTLDAAAGDYFDPAGNRIDPKKLSEVLKKGAILAVARDGKPVDPEVLKKNKDVIAVLVPKAADAPKEAPAEKKAAPDEKPYVTEVWVKDGAFTMTRQVTVFQQETREEVRTVAGGRTVKVQVQVMVPVIREMTVTMDPKAIEVQTPDGKPVDPKEWPKLLKEKTKVIASPTGKAVPEDVVKGNKDAKFIILIKAPK
jgi:hypothetical protein